MSFQAEGTIYGKFDDGYLVSIKLGSEVLNGVLYHQYQQAPSSSSGLSGQTCHSVAPSNSGLGNKRRKTRDANFPKSSGYNFFVAEQHSMLKSLRLRRGKEFTKKIAQSWYNLSPEEKKVYQIYGIEDKERYQRELKEYKKER
ncbi:high mobility group B protein 9-like [Capsicum annuum]|uniref:high mobility group B protein 9-like n=1 Tax=Capsicum annuum TaxID=4072 RepID=UPI001FB0CFEA|nr:high mobility group B protein 9-like [Capsicum annuum]